MAGVLAKQFTYHQQDSAANLVPSHRNDPFVFQHHVVASGIIVGVVTVFWNTALSTTPIAPA